MDVAQPHSDRFMDEREYRRNRSGNHNQDEGMILNYERQRYNSVRPQFSDEGANIPLSYQLEEESELYSRFGSSSELESNQTQDVAQAPGQREQDLTPQEEAQINQVFQAGIPVAVVGTYGTSLGTKVIWQSFAKVIVQRFGAVAAQALGLSAADGLLPVGEAIALGLLAVTAWQIARNWDELWAEAEQILVGQEPEPQIYTTPDGESGTIENTGHAPPEVETGTPGYDTESAPRTPNNTGHGQREQPNARDFVMEWSPSMTPAEADEYTKNSYYAGKTFYHGTDVNSARNIANGGIDPAMFDEYSTYGVGFYLGGQRAEAEPYARRKAEETGQSGAILDVRLNVQNPKVYRTSQDYWREQAEYMRQAGVDYEVEIEVAFTNYLREQGFDAIEFTDLDFYVVFKPQQVVVTENEVVR